MQVKHRLSTVGASVDDQAKAALLEAKQKLAIREPSELAASDLRAALDAFGQISGKIDNETILDRLFASFCIGK